jgi:hypothetical protein
VLLSLVAVDVYRPGIGADAYAVDVGGAGNLAA